MIFWIALFVILVIIEIVTPLELITVWFLPAVVVSFILDVLNVDYTIIISIFIVMSILGSIALFYWLRRKQKGKDLVKNKFMGNFTVESISSNKLARIRVKDVYYFVIEETGKELNIGDKVEAVRLEGNKIVVRKEKND